MSDPNPMRIKRLLISPEIFMFFQKGKYEVEGKSLPDDAKFVRAHYNGENNWFVIVVESQEFEPLYPGDEIPIIDPPAIRRLE